MATSAPRSRNVLRVLLALLGLVFALLEPAVADPCDSESVRAASGVMSVMELERTSVPVDDGHALHLCHCMHAHSGVLARTHDWRSQWHLDTRVISAWSTRMPVGPDIPLLLRPPLSARI